MELDHKSYTLTGKNKELPRRKYTVTVSLKELQHASCTVTINGNDLSLRSIEFGCKMGNFLSEDADVPKVRGGASSTGSRKRSQPSSRAEYADNDYDVSMYHPYDEDDDNDEVQEAPSGDKEPSFEQALKCAQKRDLERPKRSMSAFNCLVKEQMTEKKQAGDMVSRMGALSNQWKEMSDNDKAPYVKAAAEDRQRYNKEKAKYEKDKSQVIKRPVNGYIVFMREFRQKQKGNYKDAKELVREGARAWKRLNREQKQPYNEKSLRDSDRYAKERLYYCNKVVRPRSNDTRLRREEGAEAAAEGDEPSDMDTNDSL